MKRMKSTTRTATLAGALAAALVLTAAPAAQAQHHDLNEAHAPAAAHEGHQDKAGIDEAEADAKHAGAGTAEHAEHHALAPINWFDFSNKEQPPYVAMFLNFVLLVGMYVWLGKKPIREALKARRASVAKEIEEAQRMRQEAEDRAVVYQKKLEHLEEELKETRASLVQAGKGDRDRIIREAEEKATRMEKDAVFLIDQEMKQLRADLTREAVEIAITAAEEILRKRVTPVDQERLAEDYLAELAARTKSSASVPPGGRPSAPPAPAPQGGQS
jgi:F0F1-type ATP synthase membrane subunit b/b'